MIVEYEWVRINSQLFLMKYSYYNKNNNKNNNDIQINIFLDSKKLIN